MAKEKVSQLDADKLSNGLAFSSQCVEIKALP
jgi:hypothetical protein